MFRQAGYIIISALLILSTTGMAFTMHYCGPDLISVSLFERGNPCCSTEEGCCHNDYDYIQLESEFVTASVNQKPGTPVATELNILCWLNLTRDTGAGKALTGLPFSQHPPTPPLKVLLPQLQSFLL